MNREELYEEYSNQYPLIMGFREVTYEDWLQKEVIDLRTNKPLPPAEGAEAIKQALCDDIKKSLNGAYLDKIFDSEQNSLPLVDYLSAAIPGNTIASGKKEIENIVEQIYFDMEEWQSLALLQQQPTAEGAEEKWINVNDRLPQKEGKSSIYCLVNSEYDGIVVRPYNEYHQCWDTEDADDYYCDAIGGKITHWMPLPNPPVK